MIGIRCSLSSSSKVIAAVLFACALTFAALFASLIPLSAYAEEESALIQVESSASDWKYEIMRDGAGKDYVQILNYEGSSNAPVIPAQIDGVPVKAAYFYLPLFSDASYSTIDTSLCETLEVLNCTYVGLTSLDLSKNPNLEVLNCSRNNLLELDISNNPKLRELDCDYNKLTELSIAYNPLLERLICNNNAISDLSALKQWASKEGVTANLEPQDVPSYEPAPQLREFSGYDRYDVSRQLIAASLNNDVCKGAIVVSGEEGKFADALAANALSGLLGYPVILTNGSYVNPEAHECFKWLKNSYQGSLDIIVVGGPETVQENVAFELGQFGWVTRISGADRYELAKRVYSYGASHGGWNSDHLIVAKGNDFPDALSIAPFAAARKTPILLVDSSSSSLDAESRKLLANHDQAIVLGGVDSVSEKLYGDIQAFSRSAIRLDGRDRYEASLAIARWELEQGMSLDGVGFATGKKFTDALASGFYLSRTESILLLVDGESPSYNVAVWEFLEDNAESVSLVSIFGGTVSITQQVRDALVSALGW